MTAYQTAAAIAVTVLVGACAGRDAAPVSAFQPYDRDLSCSQIQGEMASNEEKARRLIEEDENAGDSNIAIGVVGALLFWPALFALDTGDAEMVEMEALRERNRWLMQVSSDKDCNIPPPATPAVDAEPDQPEPRREIEEAHR